MSGGLITASLEDFARTGLLGPLALGRTRLDISNALGPPSDWATGQAVNRSAVWKYGDVEVYFGPDDDRVSLIHFDWFTVPTGGPTLTLQPWVIRVGLPLAELEVALGAAGVGFECQPDAANPGCVKLVTAAAVSFLVGVEGQPDELGLHVFGISESHVQRPTQQAGYNPRRSKGGNSMGRRGYTLIDFAYPRRTGAGWDEIVRFMEYVRRHFHAIVPGVPSDSEADLIAGGSAHNPGLLPFLGLHSPPHALAAEPRFWNMIEAVGAWEKSLSDEQFWAIVHDTDAPTWVELQAMEVHPARPPEA